MSIEVGAYLENSGGNKFTENTPRPPVPGGEESDLHSNGSSLKSKSSGKSLKSNGSHSPSGAGTGTPTPRRPTRSNIGNTMAIGDKKNNKHVEAPLGFEPEGSASNSPPFTETDNSNTPPCSKWSTDFRFLIEDADGIKLFKKFLEQENQAPSTLDFYFACQGLKKIDEKDHDKTKHLAKAIHKKYVRQEQVRISGDIKRRLSERVNSKDYDRSMFDCAQQEVETIMREETYPLFVKSDLFVQYCNEGDSPKSSNSSSGTNSVRPLSMVGVGPMQTINEDSELTTEPLDTANNVEPNPNVVVALSSRALVETMNKRSEGVRHSEGSYLHGTSRLANPYHVSYAPVSAVDSELQSLSSDALTDDTMSLTDSSVYSDGVGPYGLVTSRHSLRRQQRMIRRRANENRDSLHHPFVPRTDAGRMPKDRNLAETNCKQFADLLISKLLFVEEQQKRDSLFREKLTFISEGDESISEDNVSRLPLPLPLAASGPGQGQGQTRVQLQVPAPPQSVNITHNESSSSAFDFIKQMQSLSVLSQNTDAEDSAQSILEEHCSRIGWDNSAQDTPSRSPGKVSPPRDKSPDRSSASASRRSLAHGGHSISSSGSKHKIKAGRADKDVASMVSYDSGVSASGDKNSSTSASSSKVIHHHHHHHHVIRDPPRSKSQLERNAMECSMHIFDEESIRSSGSYDTVRPRVPSKGRSTKKGSDTASNIDSGVSVACDHQSSVAADIPTPAYHPSNQKVMAWMLENEKITQGASTNTDSERSSSHKRTSHKPSSSSMSATTGSPMQHRHNTPSSKASSSSTSDKKPVAYNASRSASLEKSGLSGVISSMTTSQGMPYQPFSQDPNMPLLEPPNPTTQLEEAKRRLVNESMKAHKTSVGNRTYSGTLPKQLQQSAGKQKHWQSAQMLPVTNTHVPVVSDNEDTSYNRKPQGKKSYAAPPPPASSTVSSVSTHNLGEMTVVGYYFCGEPVPYRTKIQGRIITLGQFKQILTKKGNYRYFFKKASNEFGNSMKEVFEEIINESEALPLWEGKIVGKVEKFE